MRDNGDPQLEDNATLTLHVTNVDEPPVFGRRAGAQGSAEHRSCYEAMEDGATTSGIENINRGAGRFQLWCDMDVDGGGWDLISVSRDSGDGKGALKFGFERCTNLVDSCHGNINAGTVSDDFLRSRSDVELLIRSLDDSSVWAVLSGFSTTPGGGGFMSDYATSSWSVSSRVDCNYESSTEHDRVSGNFNYTSAKTKCEDVGKDFCDSSDLSSIDDCECGWARDMAHPVFLSSTAHVLKDPVKCRTLAGLHECPGHDSADVGSCLALSALHE